ncbi:hypothetical protein QL285_071861 [Trifolium repens]|nr:hypothetical protein QL285_071861 [Trifolium repens]
MGDTDARSRWSWNWNEALSAVAEQQLVELQGLFNGFLLQANSPDKWQWIPDVNVIFSVKSCYTMLLNLWPVEIMEENLLLAFKKLWRSDVPSKINVFGRRLLLNRLPTRTALNRRGILLNLHDLYCVFCFQHVEDCAHLFFHCLFSNRVWFAVFKWLGKSLPTSIDGSNHFLLFGDMCKSKDDRRVRHLIWLATTWNIWKHRNNVIFNCVISDASVLLEEIKVTSWVWFINRYG